jgi:hypothetical protein
MDDEDDSHLNPILSYVLERHEDERCILVLRYHNWPSHEVLFEARFDCPESVGGVADATVVAARLLSTADAEGFDAACEQHGVEVEIEPPDLTDVDLTVADILLAGPDGG